MLRTGTTNAVQGDDLLEGNDVRICCAVRALAEKGTHRRAPLGGGLPKRLGTTYRTRGFSGSLAPASM